MTILVNSKAGSEAISAPAIASAFYAAGTEPTVHQIDGASLHASTLAALKDGSRIIVAAGGDGTVSTVASALVGTDLALGILPLGRMNHFAKDLRIPHELEPAANTIAAAHTVLVDVGAVNDHVFLNNSGVGAYPHLVVERRRQRRTRWLSEAIAAVRVLREYRQLLVEVTADGIDRVVRTPFVFVGNNEYQLEGDDFGTRPRLDRGTLHLCMAPDMGRIRFAGMVASALIGRLAGGRQFESICLPAFVIQATSPRVLVSLDGEVAVLSTPLKYQTRPRALRVVVPAQ